jgi:hypothetical protein
VDYGGCIKLKNYRVKPLPYQFCKSCLFNGCYPWSRNPALRCTLNKGLTPAILSKAEETIIGCGTFKLANMWDTFVADAKTEAQGREELRLRAMNQKIRSNQREDALIF